MNVSSGASLLGAVRMHRCLLLCTVWLQIFLQLFVVLLPLQARAAPPPGIQLEEQTLSRASMYTLQPGETAKLVAQRKNLTLDDLWKLNQYRQPNREAMLRLGGGDILLIPMSERDQALPSLGGTLLSEEKAPDERIFAQQAKAFGQATGGRYSNGDAAQNFVQSQAAQAATSTVEGWLSQFGTVRANLAVSDGSDLDTSSLDMLTPLWQSRSRIFFTQFGVRDVSDRVIANLGLGQRHFTDNGWMFGYNAFYDQEITNNNARMGLGLEAWRDYLKLSTNVYMRLTNWVDSEELEDYEERPANGWDVMAQGYIPAYPQVGGKLAYEQYYGNSVALFGIDNRQKDPHAITVGVNYTPVPLVSFGVDYRQGKGGMDDTRYSMMFNYTFGVPWDEQVSSENVALRRSLAGSRLDLVDRNNEIVMEFRKKILITLGLPPEISGRSGQLYDIGYTLQSKYALSRIEWQQSELVAAGGAVVDLGGGRYQVKMPPFKYDGSPNSYPLSGIAADSKGNRSNTASSLITVNGAAIDNVRSTTTATPTDILADSQSTSLVEVKVVDTEGNPVSGLGADLTFSLAETLTDSSNQPAIAARLGNVNETAPGVYQVLLTAGNNPGSVVVTPSVGEVQLSAVTVNETVAVRNARIAQLTVNKNRAVANGADPVVYSALVLDDNDRPVKGVLVRWTTSLGQDAVPASTTNADGIATVSLTSTQAGVAIEIAQVTLAGQPQGSEPVQAPPVLFVPDAATATFSQITEDKTQALANGADAVTLTVTVVDANGNLIPAQTVNWATTLGNMSAQSTTTGVNGTSSITLTSAAAGIAQVSARLDNNAAINADPITFSGDPATAVVSTLTPDKLTALANGSDPVTYDALVVDANNNAVSGVAITLSTDRGTLAAPTGVTNAEGHYLTTLTSTERGEAIVSATIPNQPAKTAQTVTFTADANSATVTALTVNKRLVLANGTDQAIYTATVTDAQGNPVANQTVNWTTGFGTLSAPASTTGTDGTATISLTSLQAGAAIVNAQAGSSAPRAAEEVTFTGDPATVTIASITHDKSTALANGSDTITYTANVRDINDNAVPGQTITFTTNLGTLGTVTAVTNAAGQAQTTVTSVQAGTASVGASLANGTPVTATPATFIADAATARINSVTVDRTTALANGSDAVTYTATVTDANNNALPDIVVNWATTLGTLAGVQSSTGADGLATITLRSTTAGDAQVNAQLSGGAASAAPVVTFTPDAGTAQITSLTVDKTTALANGTDALTYTATVADANGNLLANQTVTLTTDRGTFANGGTGQTNAAGQMVLPLVSTQAGPVAVTGSVNGGAAVGAPAAAFIADASTATIATLTVDRTTAIANGSDSVTYTATVLDANSNPVADQAITWASSLGTLSAPGGNTGSDGVLTVSLSSLAAGVANLTATLNGTVTGADPVTFTADISTAVVTVQANTSTVPADGATPIIVTATVRDANNNVLPDLPVTYTTDFGQLSVPSGTTDANGQVTFNLTSTVAGTASVVAARLSNGVTGTGGPYQFVPDLNTAVVTLTPSSNGIYTTDSDNPVAVSVVDAFGNAIVGSVTLAADNPAVSITGSPVTLDAGGNGTATVRSATTLAAVALTATLDQNPAKTATANISFTTPVTVVSREAVDANGGNANGKTFGQGPVIAWPGARFHITLAGGSGNLSWASNNPAMTVDNDGIVTFNSNPGNGSALAITITDNLTQQVVTENWTFVSWFYTAGSSAQGDHPTAVAACLSSGGLPTLGNMTSLVNLRGNMSAYNWDTSSDYWTNESDVSQLNYYYAYNLALGGQTGYPESSQTAYVCGGE
ncbi:hypothetical protein CYR23_04670 [Chimaeribacter arupi]|nr:hypothetical protein CYR23_04670 [Chimaeribacter arupi]